MFNRAGPSRPFSSVWVCLASTGLLALSLMTAAPTASATPASAHASARSASAAAPASPATQQISAMARQATHMNGGTDSVATAAKDVQGICPGLVATFPGDGRGSTFYGLPVAVKLNGGQFNVGPSLKASLNATVCGFFVLPTINARTSPGPVNAPGAPNDCPACSISFSGGEINVDNTVMLPASITPTQPMTATVRPQAAAGTGLNIDITMNAGAGVAIPELGVNCSVNVAARLSTAGPGGQPIRNSLTNATAVATGGAPGGVGGLAPTSTCPAALVPTTNTVVGLPAGGGSNTLNAPLNLYASLT